MNKKFALMGVAGYIAPKHLRAIKETGNELVAALDKNDSVGVMDSYFPNASFFTEFERFDRHLEKLKREMSLGVDFISICTPNYLHDAHIRMALRSGASVICEKPLVLNPWNLNSLLAIEQQTGEQVNTILQLRLHPAIIALKEKIEKLPSDKIVDVDLTYLTSRGLWYFASWKGDVSKSGGIALNIGVHFFDMLLWIFGEVLDNVVFLHEHDRASGYLVFKQARVKWFLSINEDLLPENVKKLGFRTYRSIKIDGEEVEFSKGFTDLHTLSYEKILNGQGFGIEEARKSIELVYEVRNASKSKIENTIAHSLCVKPLVTHPFG